MKLIKEENKKIKKYSQLFTDRYFIQIKDIILKYFDTNTIKIILFGSRARGTNLSNSDYDICIKCIKKDRTIKIALINEDLENSNIPYKIDIIDFYNVSKELKENILGEGILWKD
ncbi:MAG: nucleotidyltransferase domain-containing protein [Spirochaetes bacterium]|nr:nucleotidyltransferase domain-containing protein [Spirochaetota bacterium]